MGLNKSKGNMYKFITHTWNAIKGECPHGCTYCYMKQWKNQKPPRIDESEFQTNLGKGNFIFVGSSIDMFAEDIPEEWRLKTIAYLKSFDNKYLLQTKNPEKYHDYRFGDNFILGCTIETNRTYLQMGNTPHPVSRAGEMSRIANKKFITIEPMMDFDVNCMASIIETVKPNWINMGMDSKNHNLPEPSKEKINRLIKELRGRKVTIKKNMTRIMGGGNV